MTTNTPNESQSSRGQWSGRLGFIAAAAGSSIGLGNIWKFPYITGENGGGAFVLVYLALHPSHCGTHFDCRDFDWPSQPEGRGRGVPRLGRTWHRLELSGDLGAHRGDSPAVVLRGYWRLDHPLRLAVHQRRNA